MSPSGLLSLIGQATRISSHPNHFFHETATREPFKGFKKWGPCPLNKSLRTPPKRNLSCVAGLCWVVTAAAKGLHSLHIQLHWSLWLTRLICFPAVHHLISETAEFLLIGDSVIRFKWSFRVELPVFLANLDFGKHPSCHRMSTLLLYIQAWLTLNADHLEIFSRTLS